MPVHLIRELKEWEAQQKAWEEVYGSNKNHTPYQSFEWLTVWWKHFGDGQLYLIRVDDDHGQVIGFAPFFVKNKYYGWPLKHLAFIGFKRTDYLDFLVHEAREEQFFSEVFQFLRQQPFRLIQLRDLPSTSTNLPFLVRELGKFFPLFTTEGDEICVDVPLPSDWETYVNGLGKRARKDVSYDRRYLANKFSAEVREYRNFQDLKASYRDLVKIYYERWEGNPAVARFGDNTSGRFEEEMFERFSQRGDLRLWVLYLDGEPAACVSGCVRNQKLFADVVAYRPQYEKQSVGSVLLGHVLEKCISDGFVQFDLSRGEEGYKYRWGGQNKRNLCITIFYNHVFAMYAIGVKRFYLRLAKINWLQKMFRKVKRLTH